MDICAAPWVHTIGEVYMQAGQPLWIVGGAVRNPLMGLPISDIDMCGPALPGEVLAFCKGTDVRAELRAAHFGTVELHVKDESGGHMAEYTTFREDSYRCGHRPEVVKFARDLCVDALRRDFSVNALYRHCLPDGLGPVEDPTGGLGHLAAGKLHTVTENPDQVLKDDGLRILRAARFQAELGLQPTDSLLDSAARYVTLLGEIAPERLHEELAKVIMADFRYCLPERALPATGSGLDTIYRIGAWPYLFDDLQYDPEAVGALADSALRGWLPPEGLAPIPARLALLFWKEKPSDLARALERLRFSVKERQTALRLATVLEKAVHEALTPFEGAQAGLLALEFCASSLQALGITEACAKVTALWEDLKSRNVPTSLRNLALHGEDVSPLVQNKGLPPSCIGRVLNDLWWAVAEGQVPNEKRILMSMAERGAGETEG